MTMVKGRTVKIVYALALSLFAAPAYIIYQGTRPALDFAPQPVHFVQQCYGTAVGLNLDLRAYALLEDVYYSTSVTDMLGQKVTSTQSVALRPGQKHRLITYRQLPVGVFNINVHADYKLNQLARRSHDYPLAVLNVVKGDSYGCYTSPN